MYLFHFSNYHKPVIWDYTNIRSIRGNGYGIDTLSFMSLRDRQDESQNTVGKKAVWSMFFLGRFNDEITSFCLDGGPYNVFIRQKIWSRI
jgi:hypothetical protein